MWFHAQFAGTGHADIAIVKGVVFTLYVHTAFLSTLYMVHIVKM